MNKTLDKWNNLNTKEQTFDPDLHSTLLEYGSKCEHITEFGVRWVESTFSFILAKPKRLISVDLDHPSIYTDKGIVDGGKNLEEAYECAEECGVDFTFELGDSLKINIEPTDLLFIDTQHSFLHLKHELYLHHSKVKKYIIMHDTLTMKYEDQPAGVSSFAYEKDWRPNEIDPGDWSKCGLGLAIEEFLGKYKDYWILEKEILTGQGLTILKRINF
jgi:hypothetical protein